MDVVADVLSWLFIATGLFFMLVGAIGIMRMPDVFTRLHAAGMTDTMGAGFILLARAALVGGVEPVRAELSEAGE